MGFQKGDPRPPNAGRKKGSKNKPKPLNVAEILSNLNIDPVHHLLALIKSGNLRDIDKSRIWMELMSYCYAKPRADINVQVDDVNASEKSKAISDMGSKIIKAIEKWNG